MNYQTFAPHKDLSDFIKCYWTLEVPAEPNPEKQRAIADGYIEMIFHLAEDVKSYTDEQGYALQPRAMILGHTIKPFFFEPTGNVDTFAVKFFPYGLANIIQCPLKDLTDKVLPLHQIFDKNFSQKATLQINQVTNTQQRISVIESLLFEMLSQKKISDCIVKNTIDMLFATKGNSSVSSLLKETPNYQRQLQRKFSQKIGLTPKQLGKIIRLQTALRMLLNNPTDKLYHIAYDADYYDQAHFIRDFKEFTGICPKTFWKDTSMEVASLMYAKE